jgi:anti-sigma B factor antagonist
MSEHLPPPGPLAISCVMDNGTASIALEGELDLANAPQLEERLADVEGAGPTRVVVDLGRLAFIDSTGLRVLLQADARARERGHELTLRPGDATVQRAFEVTGALDILRFESLPAG